MSPLPPKKSLPQHHRHSIPIQIKKNIPLPYTKPTHLSPCHHIPFPHHQNTIATHSVHPIPIHFTSPITIHYKKNISLPTITTPPQLNTLTKTQPQNITTKILYKIEYQMGYKLTPNQDIKRKSPSPKTTYILYKNKIKRE
jgi:hypothetical protein